MTYNVTSGRGSTSQFPSSYKFIDDQSRNAKKSMPLNSSKSTKGYDMNMKEMLVSELGSKEILASNQAYEK